MNLVEQIFTQAQLGTAPNPSNNPFGKGLELGLKQQQLEQAAKLLPLQKVLQEQTVEKNRYALQDILQGRQNEIAATKAFAALQEKIAPMLEDGDIGEAINASLAEGAGNSFLYLDPQKRFINLLSSLGAAMKLQTEAQRAAGTEFPATVMPLRNPETGEQVPGFVGVRTGPNQMQLVNTEAAKIKREALDLQRQRLTQGMSDAQKMQARSIWKEIDRKKEERDLLSEESGFGPWKGPNPKRKKLQDEIDKLEEQVNALTGRPAESAASPFKITIVKP